MIDYEIHGGICKCLISVEEIKDVAISKAIKLNKENGQKYWVKECNTKNGIVWGSEEIFKTNNEGQL